MKKDNIKAINKNGFIISDNIRIENITKTSKGINFFRIIIAFAACVSSILMFASFIDLRVNTFLIWIIGIFFTLAFCSFKSKRTSVKILGAAAVVFSVLYFVFSYKSIANGFMLVANKYFECVEAGIAFNEASYYNSSYSIGCFCALAVAVISLGVTVSIYYNSSFAGLFCITFPLFELGMYWGFVPDYFTFYVLVTCWVTAFAINLSANNFSKINKSKDFTLKRRKSRFYLTSSLSTVYSSYLSVLVCFCSAIVLVVSFIFSSIFSDRPQAVDNARYAISYAFENFSLKNMPDTFRTLSSDLLPTKNVGGTSGGKLGKKDEISFEGDTMLKVSIPHNAPDILYLRGYCAGNYSGDSWDQFEAEIYSKNYDDVFNGLLLPQDYNAFFEVVNSSDSVLSTITVENVGASTKYLYAPYQSVYASVPDITPTEDTYVRPPSTKYKIEYYTEHINGSSLKNYSGTSINSDVWDTSGLYDAYSDFVYENYMETDASLIGEAYNEIVNQYIYISSEKYDCEDVGFINLNQSISSINSLSLVANSVQQYFADNYKYTLSPSKTPNDEDFVEYFIEEQKEGYCSYFASAGVLLMRGFGFPARYVEGYVVTYDDFKVADDGFSANVKDYAAHAWCEVFVEGKGWIALEFTPGYENGENPNIPEKDPSVTTTTTKGTTDSPEEIKSQLIEKITTTTTATTTTSADSNSNGNDTSRTNVNTSISASISSSVASQSRVGIVTGGDSQISSDNDGKSGSKADYGKIARIAAVTAAVILLILIILWLWNYVRRASISSHKKAISDSDRRLAVIAVYKRIFELLKLVGIKSDDFLTDIQNADFIGESFEKLNFRISSDDLRRLAELAVEADMSLNSISEESYLFAYDVLEKISEDVWMRLNPFQKFCAMYLKFLY